MAFGAKAAELILGNDLKDDIISALNIVGLMVVGCIACAYANINLGFQYVKDGVVIVDLQSLINGVWPKLPVFLAALRHILSDGKEELERDEDDPVVSGHRDPRLLLRNFNGLMKPKVQACLGQLIVSCQAYEDTPLYGAETIEKMVQSAMLGGAQAVRCCWLQDIRAARSLSEKLIIIGINKVMPKGEKKTG